MGKSLRAQKTMSSRAARTVDEMAVVPKPFGRLLRRLHSPVIVELDLLHVRYSCDSMSNSDSAAAPVPTLTVSTAVTPTDHGKVVVLAAWLSFTAGLLLSAARAYIRWPLHRLAGKDDAVYAIATVLAVVQTAITINAVDRGFGKIESDLPPQRAITIAKVSRIWSKQKIYF